MSKPSNELSLTETKTIGKKPRGPKVKTPVEIGVCPTTPEPGVDKPSLEKQKIRLVKFLIDILILTGTVSIGIGSSFFTSAIVMSPASSAFVFVGATFIVLGAISIMIASCFNHFVL